MLCCGGRHTLSRTVASTQCVHIHAQADVTHSSHGKRPHDHALRTTILTSSPGKPSTRSLLGGHFLEDRITARNILHFILDQHPSLDVAFASDNRDLFHISSQLQLSLLCLVLLSLLRSWHDLNFGTAFSRRSGGRGLHHRTECKT